METSNHSIDYAQKLATLVKQLPEDRAAQLYDFARFLLAESRRGSVDVDGDDAGEVSDAELAAEDAEWEAALTRMLTPVQRSKRRRLRILPQGRRPRCSMSVEISAYRMKYNAGSKRMDTVLVRS